MSYLNQIVYNENNFEICLRIEIKHVLLHPSFNKDKQQYFEQLLRACESDYTTDSEIKIYDSYQNIWCFKKIDDFIQIKYVTNSSFNYDVKIKLHIGKMKPIVEKIISLMDNLPDYDPSEY